MPSLGHLYQDVQELVENLRLNDAQFSASFLKLIDSYIKPDSEFYNSFLLRLVNCLLHSNEPNQLTLAKQFIEQVDTNLLTDLESLHYSLFLAEVGRDGYAIKNLKTKILQNGEIVVPAIEVMGYIYYKKDQIINSIRSKFVACGHDFFPEPVGQLNDSDLVTLSYLFSAKGKYLRALELFQSIKSKRVVLRQLRNVLE